MRSKAALCRNCLLYPHPPRKNYIQSRDKQDIHLAGFCLLPGIRGRIAKFYFFLSESQIFRLHLSNEFHISKERFYFKSLILWDFFFKYVHLLYEIIFLFQISNLLRFDTIVQFQHKNVVDAKY